MIKYGIVEDNSEVREYIIEWLDTDDKYNCIIKCESVEEVLNELNETDIPDFILMDINLPGASGISGVKLIKDRFPDINIVMLTNYNDSGRIFDSLKAGASGYLLKNISFEELHREINLLLQGGAPMSPSVARKVLEYFRPEKKSSEGSVLSRREKQVVECLVEGLSYKMIADRLKISDGTIYSHIKNIYRKLHVNSKGEVIARSLRGEI
ncbi:MAG: response regulator transcription factor [Candidatus Delongbacteria bacterium]|nr:response regulator transcription factor [Candidatus Delongbacteria bacterium]